MTHVRLDWLVSLVTCHRGSTPSSSQGIVAPRTVHVLLALENCDIESSSIASLPYAQEPHLQLVTVKTDLHIYLSGVIRQHAQPEQICSREDWCFGRPARQDF